MPVINLCGTNLCRSCPWKALTRPPYEMPLDPSFKVLRNPSAVEAFDQVLRLCGRAPVKDLPAGRIIWSKAQFLEVASWDTFETNPFSSNISGQALAYLWKRSPQVHILENNSSHLYNLLLAFDWIQFSDIKLCILCTVNFASYSFAPMLLSKNNQDANCYKLFNCPHAQVRYLL